MNAVDRPFRSVALPRLSAPGPDELRERHFEPGLPCVLAGLYDAPALASWMTSFVECRERVRCVVSRQPEIRLISDAERPDVLDAAAHPEVDEFFAELGLGEVWRRATESAGLPPLVEPGEFLYVFSATLPATLPFPPEPLGGELGELLYADPRPRQLLVNARGLLNRCHAHVHSYLLHQVHGRKRVRLFSPLDTARLVPNPDRRTAIEDFDRIDAARRPAVREATAYEGVLEPGDALYLPSYWWHEIRVDEPAISIGFHAPGGAARDAALALHEGIAAALAAAVARAPDPRVLAGIAATLFTAAARDVACDGVDATVEGLRYSYE